MIVVTVRLYIYIFFSWLNLRGENQTVSWVVSAELFNPQAAFYLFILPHFVLQGRAQTNTEWLEGKVWLTVSVLQRLPLLRGFGDDFDHPALEAAHFPSVAQEQSQQQGEMLPLVLVGDEQGLGTSKHLLQRKQSPGVKDCWYSVRKAFHEEKVDNS